VETISASGNPQQLARILPKMVTGEWMGTMNLTESQAGSDPHCSAPARWPRRSLPDLRAEIFITYGDHDLTDNIIHLVLARIDGAPPGTRGISLFFVPKNLINADGTVGAPNDVRCISIEHKLEFTPARPVMAFGERWRNRLPVGVPHTGLSHMFIMMNAARLSWACRAGAIGTGVAAGNGVGAYRLQGKPAGGKGPGRWRHRASDVKRMLSMRARTEAMRALTYYAAEVDCAHRVTDQSARRRIGARN
jgi:alkylation response protein AidB-like acyl-CoA dehydrogenase